MVKQKFIIDGEVFNASIWNDHDIFIAECPELNLHAQGKSIKIARVNLIETTRMFLQKEITK
ncbi:MAG: hypothetical protein NT038_00760 [Euryarchaeota archaeon]|nr:hypothetical protein [Euryarchaeota archaeon]